MAAVTTATVETAAAEPAATKAAVMKTIAVMKEAEAEADTYRDAIGVIRV